MADALQHHLKLGHVGTGQRFAADGAPRLEPFHPRGERADAGLGPVGDHQQLVHGEQRRQLGLVGLELLPGLLDRGVLVGGVLELDHAQGQAVDEEHDVGTAVVLVLDDGELVDREEVVRPGVGEVDDLHRRPPHGAAGVAVLHRHAVDQHPVEGAVARLQRRPLRQGQLAEGVVQRRGGQLWVEPRQRIPQPLLQDDLPEVVALGVGGARGDVRAVCYVPADIAQPVEGGLFNVAFGDGGHRVVWILGPSPSTARMRFFSLSRRFAGVVHTM